MTSITWAGPRCVQEPAAILAPQNRTQGRCEALSTTSLRPIRYLSPFVAVFVEKSLFITIMNNEYQDKWCFSV